MRCMTANHGLINIFSNLQYLGEEGPDCALKAAVVCGSPWNLEVSSLALQRSWLGLGIYSRVMGSNMKKLFELYAKKKIPYKN